MTDTSTETVERFIERFIEGAQGCHMDPDNAQEFARILQGVLAERAAALTRAERAEAALGGET
jgi:ABC-type nitrate/sulfonate/bicarbonate transport system substrate-binding protein